MKSTVQHWWRGVAAMVLAASGTVAQGYRLEQQAIHVDRSEHWRGWTYQNDVVWSLSLPVEPSGFFNLGDDGLQPRFFRKSRDLSFTRAFCRTSLGGAAAAAWVVAQTKSRPGGASVDKGASGAPRKVEEI